MFKYKFFVDKEQPGKKEGSSKKVDQKSDTS